MSLFDMSVIDNIEAYVQQLDLAVDQGLAVGCGQIAVMAQGRVRHDTGSLADTIDAEMIASGSGLHEWSINAGNTTGGYKGGSPSNSKPAGAPVDYAIDQEYGGGDAPNTPYMTPASEDGWPILQQAVAGSIAGISE